jgi:phosphopantetheinyl transferase
MPLLKKQTTKFWLLGLWEINEPEEKLRTLVTLNPAEQKRIDTIKHPRPRREFLAVRCLLKELLPDQNIQYYANGQPYLERGWKISISHNGQYAAIICSPSLRVGIDIENYRPKVLELLPRFCHDREQSITKATTEAQKLAQATSLWCAKETLLKIAGDRQHSFKNDLRIAPFPQKKRQTTKALIKSNNTSIKCQLYLQQLESFALCYGYASA